MKQLAFLVISSPSSLKNIAQNFKPLVQAESPYFHGLWYSYLRLTLGCQNKPPLSIIKTPYYF